MQVVRNLKIRRLVRTAAIQCFVAALALLFVELGFRAATNGPRGIFKGWFPGRQGLYPESAEIPMPGVVPWVIRTNRLGLRGGDVPLERTPGIPRIAMVGDSITDGFFVENENTFPAFTEAGLRRAGVSAEVMNFARGGATIDTQLAILRDVVTPLRPDVVVLTFVTNDVAALADVGDADLLTRRLARRDLKRSLLEAAVTRSALGERAFDAYLRWRAPGYRSALSGSEGPLRDPERYLLPGGRDFARNSQRFMETFKDTDGAVLTEVLAPETRLQARRYLTGWDAFMQWARAHRMKPVFVYFPAYPQVYDPEASFAIRDLLEEHSAAREVPFLDLTPALQSAKERVLHLAPADFHLNPEGNRVIGDALAAFLLDRLP